jgi:putative ABC transport system permease protein
LLEWNFLDAGWGLAMGWVPRLKTAWRGFSRTPWVSVVTLGALAFAIALSTHQFVVGRGLIAPLPVPLGSRFMTLERVGEQGGINSLVALDTLASWRDRSTSFDGLAAYATRQVTLGNGVDLAYASVSGAALTDNAMALLGVEAVLGRTLLPGDGTVGAEPVAVLGYELWRIRFGADPAMVGRQIPVDGEIRTVVGIMPPGYGFPRRGEFWIPLQWTSAAEDGRTPSGVPFGRLREGASRETAQAEFRATVGPRGRIVPFTRAGETFQGRLILIAFRLGMGVLVLAVLGNVATLTLARNLYRVRDIAIRQALGATRPQVIGQLLVESMLLSAAAATVAMAGVLWGLSYWRTGQSPPYWAQAHLDWVGLLFFVAVTLFSGVAIGLLPALKVTARDLRGGLREGAVTTRGVGFGSASGALLIVQCALSVGILGGASGMIRALRSAGPPGSAGRGADIVVANVSFRNGAGRSGKGAAPGRDGGSDGPTAARRSISADLLAHPNIVSVAWGTAFPGQAVFRTARISYPGDGGSEVRTAPVVQAGPGYFRTLGATIIQGHDFDEQSGDVGGDEVLMSRRLAVALFGGDRVVGRDLRVQDPGTQKEEETLRIIGVVSDEVPGAEASIGTGYLYRPLKDETFLRLGIRSRGGPTPEMQTLYSVVVGSRAPVKVGSGAPLSALLSERSRVLRVFGRWVSGVGFVAWTLTLMSVYAMMSFTVVSRTAEVGIRLCLGASRLNVLVEVMGRGMMLMGIGAGIGVVVGFGVSRLTAILPYDHEPSGLGSLLIAASLMMGVGALAVVGPLRRLGRLQAIDVVRSGTQ